MFLRKRVRIIPFQGVGVQYAPWLLPSIKSTHVLFKLQHLEGEEYVSSLLCHCGLLLILAVRPVITQSTMQIKSSYVRYWSLVNLYHLQKFGGKVHPVSDIIGTECWAVPIVL